MAAGSGLRWRINRLRCMSAAEIGFRVWRAGTVQLEKRGIGLAPAPRPPRAALTPSHPWIESLPQDLDPAPYVASAERILAGRFDVFSLKDAQLGFPPNWLRDPKTGVVAPLEHGKAIDYRSERLVGDIKYLWEPSRHLELVTLAQAYFLTRDPRYVDGARTYLGSWLYQSPYPKGPHWSSSLESGYRLVNWSFAWHLFGGADNALFTGADGEAFRQRWLASIAQHLHFTVNYLSRHSSANNHLLGELTGVFVGATVWPDLDPGGRLAAYAARELEREVVLQNAPDGVNREQTTHYQRSVIDMMLVNMLYGRANGRPFSDAFTGGIERLIAFLAAVIDQAGQVPDIGDSDEGVLLRLTPHGAGWNQTRSLLAIGAALFSRADFKAAAGRFDEKALWLLGRAGAAKFDALSLAATPPIRRAFPDGGYWILGQDFGTGQEIKITADAGPLGYLHIAAHGHADALALTMSVAGRQILIDPGTYAYHVDETWRNHFRSTAAHNTVTVDGTNQSEIGGNFMWLQKAEARCEAFEIGERIDRWVARHEGYRRLEDPLTHRRTVEYDRSSRSFRVSDELLCQGRHEVALNWHFHPDTEVRFQADGRLVAQNGPVRVTLSMMAGEAPARLLIGDESEPAGWYSPSFDHKLPSPTIRWAVPIHGSTTLVSNFEVSFE